MHTRVSYVYVRLVTLPSRTQSDEEIAQFTTDEKLSELDRVVNFCKSGEYLMPLAALQPGRPLLDCSLFLQAQPASTGFRCS